MLFTRLNEIPQSRQMIDTFKGYNHNLRIGAGEFYDMKNMTGDHYPVLSPRSVRRFDSARNPAVWNPKNRPQGMTSQNGLCFVINGVLYYGYLGGLYKSVDLSLSEGEKQLVNFGAYIIILPDKKWFNTIDATFGSCEAEFDTNSASVEVAWCKQDGTVYETIIESNTEPSEPENGTVWLDIAQAEPVLKMWYATTAMWSVINPTYLKITCDNIAEGFEVEDSVTFHTHADSGFRQVLGTKSYEIVAKDTNFIVIQGSMSCARLELKEEQFGMYRSMPTMDFMFEHENRLWGCRYGLADNGEFVNEIYASKLGDFKNWSSFKGISTDSYIASCGTEGKWTGAIKAMGYPIFFKENCIYKVYGSYPAQYQLQIIPCRGVQEGCEKSLACVNEVLFYKSRSGICAYDGALPSDVSAALGNETYSDAVAGSVGDKYYISMKDAKEGWHLFCFDTKKGFWHREDALQVDSFCTVRDELYYIEHDAPWIRTIGEAQHTTALEEKVSWYAQTGVLGADDPDHKYLSRITVRMSMALGTRVKFLVQYDSCGSWEMLATITGRSLNSFSVPMRPKRCDHLRLRIEGEGDAKIYAMTLTTEQGSDIR